MGIITDNTNRVRLLGVAGILWSSTTLISGEVDNFYVFIGMRVLFGMFSAAANPPAFSLIRDFFPPNYRSTANSVYAFSHYGGVCLASLSILFIKKYGWREDYDLTGVFGILFGILCLTVIKEPERGRFDK